ncbi:MAG: MarR family winged helix-turn-helix transcriptional regulator [Clostridiales bacterium]|nr:MarR family winged helix-turn-helix transcriptional regulator [Clostridiales bacterium]
MDKQYLPCFCMTARRAAGSLTSCYDKLLADEGITITQFSLMINIKSAKTTNITELTKKVKLDKSTLTRTLAPLIEEGYIHSERGESRREVILSLTEKGQQKTADTFPKWRALQKKMEEYLGGEDEAWDFVNKLIALQQLKYDDIF